MRPGRFLVQPLLWLLLVVIAVLSVGESAAADDPVYLDELQRLAAEKHLSEHPQWHKLLHYRPRSFWFGVESFADDPSFFNAVTGKTDPDAELQATLASFFTNEEDSAGDQHPQCRFVARYHWLRSQLNFDKKRLVPRYCEAFEQWMAGLDAQGVSLVFPSAYLNNPASMFGHTLLRIDVRGQDEKTGLLAYSASFGAVTGDDGGVRFAVKGLSGQYQGVFSVEPYYKRVAKYSDMENRDIWEYSLNFSEQEVLRLLMHLWELTHVYFDYYFFDENCSYHLLSLLDSARADLGLRRKFGWWVVPSDTVREVANTQGLVGKVTYRPASSTKLRHRLDLMSKNDEKLVLDLIKRKESVEGEVFLERTEEERARVLELAFDYLDYRRLAGKDPQGRSAELAREFLVERSKLARNLDPIEVPPPAIRPEQGHGPGRLSLGVGWEDERWFYETSVRPAYHELLDPQGGYTPGAQIEFLSLTLRHYESDNLQLHRFTPVNIVSLAPRNVLIKPVSWKVGTSVTRKRIEEGLGELVAQLRGGPGLSKAVFSDFWLYAFLESSLEYSPRYKEDNLALGLGPSGGLLVDLSRGWRLGLSGSALRFGVGDDHSEYRFGLDQQFSFGSDWGLRVSFAREGEFGNYRTRAMISGQRYF